MNIINIRVLKVLLDENKSRDSFTSPRKSTTLPKSANARTVFAELKLSWPASLTISVVNIVCKRLGEYKQVEFHCPHSDFIYLFFVNDPVETRGRA